VTLQAIIYAVGCFLGSVLTDSCLALLFGRHLSAEQSGPEKWRRSLL
jgi:hypothetical protein